MDTQEKKYLLGLTIVKEREKLGLNQEQLSNLIGISPNNLSNIENGKSFPSLETFCAIVESLNIEPNELLSFLKYGTNSKNRLDIEIAQNLKSVSDNLKIHLNEIIKKLQ